MNIYITAPFEDSSVRELEKSHKVTFDPWSEDKELLGEAELHSVLAESKTEIYICESEVITDSVLEGLSDLKMICVCRAGLNDVDIPAATRRGIIVTNTPGRNAEAVAEMTVALIIMVSRFMTQGEMALRSGNWDEGLYFRMRGPELSEKTIGLIGFGNVPRRIAKLLSSFNVDIIAYDPFVDQSAADAYQVKMVGMDEIFRRADFVSNHLPLTEQTTGCINSEKFALMKPTAYFLNTARAATVDENAMIKALQNKEIAGAALDVYSEEPLPMESPLLKLDNVTLMPHLCGASSDVVKNHSRMVLEDIGMYMSGKSPVRLANRELSR